MLDLPTYLVGLVVIILLPGPNSLYVLATASRDGVRRGFAAAAGVWTGDTVLMALAVGGVASLLQSHQFVFGIVKYLGAGYLAWVGLGLVRAGLRAVRARGSAVHATALRLKHGQGGQVENDGQLRTQRARAAVTAGSVYRRALAVSLLNPKAILFFVSFFVQFVDPAYPHPWVSFLFLGGLVQVASVLYLSALIVLGHRVAAAFRRSRRLSAGATATAGVVFLGFAAKLGLASAA